VRAISMSRRNLFALGTVALAGTSIISHPAKARTGTAHSTTTEDIVRRWYKAWEKRDWGPIDTLLAENFTFTSAADDDHISKSAFKKGCWETQIDFIDHFEIEQLFGQGNEAFVKYLCRTKNGKSFRNVEYVRVRNEQVEAIECYFGGHSTFPSAVSKGQGRS
jgi:ketosteroid isomerase-like protein